MGAGRGELKSGPREVTRMASLNSGVLGRRSSGEALPRQVRLLLVHRALIFSAPVIWFSYRPNCSAFRHQWANLSVDHFGRAALALVVIMEAAR